MLVTEALEIGCALERQPSRQIALDHLVAGDEVPIHGRRHRGRGSLRRGGLCGGGLRRGRRCGFGCRTPRRDRGGFRGGCRRHRGRGGPRRWCRGGPRARPAGEARWLDPGGGLRRRLRWRSRRAGRRGTRGGHDGQKSRGRGSARGSLLVRRARGGELGGRRGQSDAFRDRHARRRRRLRVATP